jgi:hypothetical protein
MRLCERKESVYACTREEPVCARLARSKVAMRWEIKHCRARASVARDDVSRQQANELQQ